MAEVDTVRSLWTFEDQCGAEAPKDADPRVILTEMLTFIAGMTVDDCTPTEIERLTRELRYTPLFSVVKADHWDIDPDDCGGWHSDASGKRVKECWFIDKSALYAVEDRFLSQRAVPDADTPDQTRDIRPQAATSPSSLKESE